MTDTFDRVKLESILSGYPVQDWDAEQRTALINELQAQFTDVRLAAIQKIVDEQVSTVGLYPGTPLWEIHAVLIGGHKLPELRTVTAEDDEDTIHVSVLGVKASLTVQEAETLIRSVQKATRNAKAVSAKRAEDTTEGS